MEQREKVKNVKNSKVKSSSKKRDEKGRIERESMRAQVWFSDQVISYYVQWQL